LEFTAHGYLGEERDQSKSVAEAAWVLEVIDTYVAHLRTGAWSGGRCRAACVYRARHPIRPTRRRDAAAEIISHKL
jgi:hypothetical protein